MIIDDIVIFEVEHENGSFLQGYAYKEELKNSHYPAIWVADPSNFVRFSDLCMFSDDELCVAIMKDARGFLDALSDNMENVNTIYFDNYKLYINMW